MHLEFYPHVKHTFRRKLLLFDIETFLDQENYLGVGSYFNIIIYLLVFPFLDFCVLELIYVVFSFLFFVGTVSLHHCLVIIIRTNSLEFQIVVIIFCFPAPFSCS